MTYIKAIDTKRRMDAVAFQQLELAFGKTFAGMKPRNAFEIPAEQAIKYVFKKKKVATKSTKTYLKLVSPKHMRAYVIKAVKFGKLNPAYDLFCFFGQSEEEAHHGDHGNDITINITIIVVGGDDGGGDDGGGDEEPPKFKDCQVDICEIRGEEADCVTHTVSVPENEACPDANAGCGGACGGLPGDDGIFDPVEVLGMNDI
jgi:hypothetical protein